MTFRASDSPVRVSGDIHSWMSARVYAFDHPWFAKTGDVGTFTIEGVPVGTHRLRAIHETFGEVTTDVTVTADATTDVEITLTQP